MEFIEMLRKSHSDKESKSQKTIESMQMHDPFSMGKAMAILNTIGNVDDYTLFKILNGLHKLESGLLSSWWIRKDNGSGWI